jgi:hypothetical protein
MRISQLSTTAALALAAAALSACVSSIDGPQSPAFGEGLASVQAQAVEVAASDVPPETSGQVAAAAVERYKTGKTRPVEVYSTSTLGLPGGGYGGGGSGGGPE